MGTREAAVNDEQSDAVQHGKEGTACVAAAVKVHKGERGLAA